MPDEVFQDQVTTRGKQTMEIGEQGLGIWQGMQALVHVKRLKALGWKWEIGLSVRPHHDVFEPKVEHSSEALMRQHIWVAVDARQFGRRNALMQQGKQDASSTGDIEQVWDALPSLGMSGKSLDIERCEG